MNIRTHGFTAITIALLMLLTVISTQVNAVPQKAIAITQTAINFINMTAPGKIDSVAITGAKSLSGVAVYNSTVAFITDSTANTLHIVDLLNPSNQRTIELKNQSGTLGVSKPTSVAVDASGGVYVVGSKWEDAQSQAHYAYAYLNSTNWLNFSTTVDMSLVELASSPMVDVAASGTNGIILQQYIGTPNAGTGVAYVREVSGVSAGSPTAMGATDNYFPRAIAVDQNSQFAYIISKWLNDEGMYTSSICAYNLTNGNKNTTLLPSSIAPDDIAWFSTGSTNYLGVVGNVGGVNKAWRFELDPSGYPIIAGALDCSLDASSQHQCAVSEDGGTFWVTNPLAGTVQMLNTSTWTLGGSYLGLDRVQSIATFVPEPSGLAMLITFGTGMLAMVRRRRR